MSQSFCKLSHCPLDKLHRLRLNYLPQRCCPPCAARVGVARSLRISIIMKKDPRPAAPRRPAEAGELTPAQLASLRQGYRMSESDRACHHAVSNNPAKALALNRGLLRGDDGHFSHKIHSKGITNQRQSGRCWMFAGLNILRPQVIREHGMEEFEFSAAFLQFWDKLEKSNLYLESVLELRAVDFLDREWELVNKWAMEDGGWWNYLVALVEKYGVVPQAAMPETHASSNTATLNEVLGRLLRARAARLLEHHAAGAGLDELRDQKQAVLAEVYRLLVLHFGEPPAGFEWRFPLRERSRRPAGEAERALKSPENQRLSPAEQHTPQSFFEKFVGRALAGFVCLYNDPLNEFGRRYRFDRARNIVGRECMDFVNIDSATMKKIAKASILANEPLWFAVNMGFDQSPEHGQMQHRLYDYESLFGIDLSLAKAERTRFHSGTSGHAMALMGVDLAGDGRPRKWLVENSWGDEKGRKGWWTLGDEWFDEHVYTIIVNRRHVPKRILAAFAREARLLPAWYPGAAGIQPPPHLP
jgi:bleomycin hydrolase